MTALGPGRQALVLSGGGANAAYGVGVMKALVRGESPATGYRPLNPEVFAGASGGSFNAAFMVSDAGADSSTLTDRLEDIWVNSISNNPESCGNGVYRIRSNPFRYLDLNCFTANPLGAVVQLAGDSLVIGRGFFERAVNFALSAADLEHRVLEFLDLSQFISDQPLRQRLPSLFGLEGIRRSPKVLKIIATDWSTGELRVFSNQDFTDEVGYDIIHASAAIPGVFQPRRIGRDLFVDGGLVLNTPLMPAIKAGADTLHVVYQDPDIKNVPLRRLQNTLDTLDRVRAIDWATRMNEDIATARWINQGLETLERVAQGGEPTDEDLKRFVRVGWQIEEHIREGAPYRKLTLHRYHPREDLGGALGLLNFDQDQIRGVINRGFLDAAEHDCQASQCLLATTPRGGPQWAPGS